jgi:hypothetical protein
MPIEKVRKTADNLLTALTTREQAAIQQAQQKFSRAVEEAWQEYQGGNLDIQSKQTLPQSMYLYATRELPQEVAWLRRWSTVEREISNFLKTVNRITPSHKK